jgi:hypothetical protein
MSDCIDTSIPIERRPDMWEYLPEIIKKVTTHVFTMGECRIIVSYEPTGYHLSISCKNRLPSYGELVTARYRLLPRVKEMSMHFPPMDEFINVHPYTLHLFQTR